MTDTLVPATRPVAPNFVEDGGGAPRPAKRPPLRALARRRPRHFHLADALVLAGSLAASMSLTWVVFYQLTFLAGASGYLICSGLAFLAIYYGANRYLFGASAAADRVVAALVTLCAGGVVFALALVVGFLAVKGYHLVSWSFLTHDQKGVGELASASSGGISHAIVGTLEQVGLAVAIGAPAGVITAIFLNEVKGRFTRAVRTVVTAMSALPSVVAGLFIYVVVVVGLGYHYRGFAGSLALSIMLLPNVTRTTEEVLKVVHDSLREAATALGAPHWRTVWSVVLPTARSGLATAVLLGVARIVGETAPLIMTVFGNTVMNANPFANRGQEALPLFIFDKAQSSQAADIERAFAAGLVLVVFVLVFFVLARIIAAIRPGTLGIVRDRLRVRPKEGLA